MKKFDYILKNGHIIDPGNKIDEVMDIAILDNKIAKVGINISDNLSDKVYDISGLLVTPGLIDSHVHCYYSAGINKAWAGDYSLQPDYFSFRSGTTTVIDTGSAGSYNFPHFRTTVIERSKTRIFAFLNIADYGMSSLEGEQFPNTNDYDSFIDCTNKNTDIIKGIKVAHYWGKDWADIDYAKKLQKSVNLPIMVDFGVFKKERPYDKLVLEKLDEGDISTHCFRSAVPVLDEEGKVYDYLYKARDRGIIFDLGHGAASFMMRNGVPAMSQGFLPDIISTDLHALNANGTVMDIANLLSKILACCDISYFELFKRVTSNPAKLLNLGDIGTLSEDGIADISIWSIREGDFGFQDMSGGSIRGNRKLECEMTFRDGEIVWDLNARAGTPYEEMPELYGFDPSKEDLVLPEL